MSSFEPESAMNHVLQSLRSFRASPALVGLTVSVLALGIGANVAIFSVVNEALLRPLPYRDPERLSMLWERIPELTEENLGATAADYLDYRAQTRAFESIAAFEPRKVNLAFGGEADRVSAVRVTEPLVLAGLLLGILGTLVLGQSLASQLYSVSPRDPRVLSGVGLFVVLMASIAAYLPARRAARVNPTESLRSE